MKQFKTISVGTSYALVETLEQESKQGWEFITFLPYHPAASLLYVLLSRETPTDAHTQTPYHVA